MLCVTGGVDCGIDVSVKLQLQPPAMNLLFADLDDAMNKFMKVFQWNFTANFTKNFVAVIVRDFPFFLLFCCSLTKQHEDCVFFFR